MQQGIFWLCQGRKAGRGGKLASSVYVGDVVVQLRTQMADMINRRELELSL
jgi:hypothetical protein